MPIFYDYGGKCNKEHLQLLKKYKKVNNDVLKHPDFKSDNIHIYDVYIVNPKTNDIYKNTVKGTYKQAIESGLNNIEKYNKKCVIDRIDRVI